MTATHRTAVGITGVCGGIGKELAEFFLKENHLIVGLDISQEGIDICQSEWGKNFLGIQVDVSKKSQFIQACQKVEREVGIPRIWINNAGIVIPKPFREMQLSDFEKVMRINFDAVLWGTHFWLERMTQHGEGSIVNVASIAGKIAAPNLSSYNASKFAVVGFTQSLQIELDMDKSPIHLILVTPGFVDTDILHTEDDHGFPEKLKFLTTSAKECAVEIGKGILACKKEITPTLNGKLLKITNRISPDLVDSISKLFSK